MTSELLVSRLGDRIWAALREDGTTVVIYPPPAEEPTRVGRIFKARVSNVVPGIQSAFLDIGSDREAFLHASDLWLPGEQTTYPDEEEAADSSRPPIEDRLKVGRDLLVQVIREPLSSKGPRVSCYISIAGRLLVLSPFRPRRAVSRRIEEPEERARLLAALEGLPGGEVGFVARTASAGASEEVLRAEADALIAGWKRVGETAAIARAPSVIQRESESLMRLLRDAPREGLERVVVDDPADRELALEFLRGADPELVARVRLHDGPVPLIEQLLEEIERSLRPRVELASGGYLVIEETEALVSIDVNSGRFVGRSSMEETALDTNLEAVEELARQLRLRDLGGIIVVDLIDMEREESRSSVIEATERALRRDRAPTRVIGLSELGLLQLTRKRTRPGLGATLSHTCPLCAGQARIRSPHLVSARLLLELRRRFADGDRSGCTIRAHPDVVRATMEATTTQPMQTIRFREDPQMPPDAFELKRWPEPHAE
jgi:ribonuclease G